MQVKDVSGLVWSYCDLWCMIPPAKHPTSYFPFFFRKSVSSCHFQRILAHRSPKAHLQYSEELQFEELEHSKHSLVNSMQWNKTGIGLCWPMVWVPTSTCRQLSWGCQVMIHVWDNLYLSLYNFLMATVGFQKNWEREFPNVLNVWLQFECKLT